MTVWYKFVDKRSVMEHLAKSLQVTSIVIFIFIVGLWLQEG